MPLEFLDDILVTGSVSAQTLISQDISANGFYYGDGSYLQNVKDLEISTLVRNSSGDWNANVTTVNLNSANWDYGYGAGTAYALTSANPSVDTITVNNSALFGGNLEVLGDVTIFGNLSTFGDGPVLTVTQSGNQPIAMFYDGIYPALVIDGSNSVTGYVGIGTATPNTDLTVIGEISSTATVYASSIRGTFYGDGSNITGLNIPAGLYVAGSNVGAIQPLSGNNTASGYYSNVVGGQNNTASGDYSFIGGGNNNLDNSKSNIFILGSNISALSANFTYVNNLSSQGSIYGNGANIAGIPKKYSTIIGNASATSFLVNHNLGTQDVITQVYDVSSLDVVYPTIYNTNTNQVTINFSFGNAPALSSLKVVIIG